ncbi:MAG: hypothetical protein LBG70_01580, partial [Bifidobacteriaceae bacterium]|nr:hypothetical protein [Bifidobacteriaceae bacterium]
MTKDRPRSISSTSSLAVGAPPLPLAERQLARQRWGRWLTAGLTGLALSVGLVGPTVQAAPVAVVDPAANAVVSVEAANAAASVDGQAAVKDATGQQGLTVDEDCQAGGSKTGEIFSTRFDVLKTPEHPEGYEPGPIDGQHCWRDPSGLSVIVAADADAGTPQYLKPNDNLQQGYRGVLRPRSENRRTQFVQTEWTGPDDITKYLLARVLECEIDDPDCTDVWNSQANPWTKYDHWGYTVGLDSSGNMFVKALADAESRSLGSGDSGLTFNNRHTYIYDLFVEDVPSGTHLVARMFDKDL